MKKTIKYSLVLFVWVFAFNANAQNNTICGKVIDANTKQAIAYVNVWIENTVVGTTTDEDGNFCLKINDMKSSDIVLSFSSLSYQSQTLKINTKSNAPLRVYMNPSKVQLSEVVVSSNKNSTSIKEQTTIPVLLPKQMIVESCAQNIPELLLKLPGVSLVGSGYHTAPSIRGLARKRVVVMLDGEKISSERNVGAPGTFVNPFEIERIEILKGPYSTLYGSDAIGGVVNIISKSFERPYYGKHLGGRLDMAYKTVNNAKNINLSLNGRTKKLRYRISGGYRDADNYKTPDGTELMNSFYKEQHFGGKLIYKIDKNQTLSLKSYYSKGGPIGFPAFSTLVNAIHDHDDHLITGINYKLKNVSKLIKKIDINITRHTHKLSADILVHKKENNPANDKLVTLRKDIFGADYIAQYNMYFKMSDKFKMLSGFDGYFRENINVRTGRSITNYNTGTFIMARKDTLLNDASQRNYGLFTQADYSLSHNLHLNGGLRYSYITTKQPDKPDDDRTNHALSGNIGVSYSPIEKLSIKANIGSAYRAPDIKELYMTTQTPGGMNISNPNLTPEQSVNLDLAFVYQGRSSLWQLSTFRNQINHMVIIDWDYTTNPRTGTYKNIGKGLLYGVEFSYNQKISKHFSGDINLTQIYGYDLTTNDELMDVPPLQLNTGIKYSFKNKLWFHLSGRYSAKQTDVAEDDFPNDEFTVFDFSMQWKILQNLNANFSVTNILNKEYREHYQFNWMHTPGRSFNFGVNYNF